MQSFDKESSLFKEYLGVLDVPVKKPDLNTLKELISSHLSHIPFENISKLYYKKIWGLNYIPNFEQYIEGIRKYNFGGTCYSNNFYFNQLLKHLGYKVILCGADMSSPDVHIVSVVTLENQEYIVDVGYAAPFFEPMPRSLSTDFQINFGNDKYVLLPKDENGFSQLKFYRNGTPKHGYTVKSSSRTITEFDHVIKSSFDSTATFMNAILLVLFGVSESHTSMIIHNFSVTKFTGKAYEKIMLAGKNELIEEIENKFRIPKKIVEESLSQISDYKDAWN
jgi:N-hydroxyarylamine O-acetyltransferase